MSHTLLRPRVLLFSDEDVRQTLAGRKREHRELVPYLHPDDLNLLEIVNDGRVKYRRPAGHPMIAEAERTHGYRIRTVQEGAQERLGFQVGDTVYVREAFRVVPIHGLQYRATHTPTPSDIARDRKETGHKYRWQPAKRMVLEYCRLRLNVTNVTLQAVRDITEQDALREGMTGPDPVGLYQAYWHDRHFNPRLNIFSNPATAVALCLRFEVLP